MKLKPSEPPNGKYSELIHIFFLQIKNPQRIIFEAQSHYQYIIEHHTLVIRALCTTDRTQLVVPQVKSTARL